MLKDEEVAVLALIGLALLKPKAQPPPPPPPACEYYVKEGSGQVRIYVDAWGTWTPVAGASLKMIDSSWRTVFTCYTDDAGRFTFPYGVPEMNYQIGIEKEGFIPQSWGFMTDAKGNANVGFSLRTM